MPRSNESIYELWEMEPEEFNQWQAAHAIAAAGWPNVTASITVKSATLEPGTPVALFQTRIGGGANYAGFRQQYDERRPDQTDSGLEPHALNAVPDINEAKPASVPRG